MGAEDETDGQDPAVQATSVQREGEDDEEEEVQALAVQREGEEEEEETPEEA